MFSFLQHGDWGDGDRRRFRQQILRWWWRQLALQHRSRGCVAICCLHYQCTSRVQLKVCPFVRVIRHVATIDWNLGKMGGDVKKLTWLLVIANNFIVKKFRHFCLLFQNPGWNHTASSIRARSPLPLPLLLVTKINNYYVGFPIFVTTVAIKNNVCCCIIL